MKLRNIVVASIIITAYIPVFYSARSSAVQNPGPEDIVPASAAFHGRGARYSPGIDIFLFFIQKIAPASGREKTIQWMNSFASATGIDPGQKNSLELHGFDTERPYAVSYFPMNEKEGDFLFVIPVKNGKTFPYKFVDIIRKKAGTKKNIDIHPAITRYGSYSMFQIQKDIFFSSHEQYFLISSSGTLLRNALDCASKKAGSESLANDAGYRDFLNAAGENYQVSLFARNGMSVTDALSPFITPAPQNEDDEGDAPAASQGGKASVFGSTGISISKSGNIFRCAFFSKLNPDNPASGILQKSIQARASDKCVFFKDFLFYSYLSFNPKPIHQFCEDERNSGTALCATFHEFSELLMKYTNLIIEKDFVNSFDGISNIAVKKSALQGHPDHYVLYFVMKDWQSSEAFWNTMKEYLEDSEDIGYSFSEKKIGAAPSFSITNVQGSSTYYANSNDAFFISNNAEFLGRMIEEKKKDIQEICDTVSRKKIDPTVFTFTSITLEDDSFIKAILLLSTYNSNRLLYNIINNTRKMEMVGKINRNTIMFDLDIQTKNTATSKPHNN
jgi:hypothetical protein